MVTGLACFLFGRITASGTTMAMMTIMAAMTETEMQTQRLRDDAVRAILKSEASKKLQS